MSFLYLIPMAVMKTWYQQTLFNSVFFSRNSIGLFRDISAVAVATIIS